MKDDYMERLASSYDIEALPLPSVAGPRDADIAQTVNDFVKFLRPKLNHVPMSTLIVPSKYRKYQQYITAYCQQYGWSVLFNEPIDSNDTVTVKPAAIKGAGHER